MGRSNHGWTNEEFRQRISDFEQSVLEVFGDKYEKQVGINHVSLTTRDNPPRKVIDLYVDGTCIAVYDKEYVEKAYSVSEKISEKRRGLDFKVVNVGF